MRHFGDLYSRIKRRKQVKIGRFDKDKYIDYEFLDEKAEYNFKEVSEYRLELIKNEIRSKINRRNRNVVMITIVIAIILIYLFSLLY